MTANDIFGDWMKVIDSKELTKVVRWLNKVNKETLCPTYHNIFKAFKLCSLHDCKVIWLGMDPFPQKGVATGILFGNSPETPEEQLSPSLKVVKEAIINYEIPHNNIIFDNSLESIAEQGVLMINTALTCEVGKTGSHFEIWRPFVSTLIHNLSQYDSGYIFLLFGNQAKYFKKDIVGNHYIIDCYHPSYYARKGWRMPSEPFLEMNSYMRKLYNQEIELYKEGEYGNC